MRATMINKLLKEFPEGFKVVCDRGPGAVGNQFPEGALIAQGAGTLKNAVLVQLDGEANPIIVHSKTILPVTISGNIVGRNHVPETMYRPSRF
jgi:hypothetical protein